MDGSKCVGDARLGLGRSVKKVSQYFRRKIVAVCILVVMKMKKRINGCGKY